MRLRYLAPLLLLVTTASWSQAIPHALQGTWRVSNVLTPQSGCWAGDKADKLLNTTLTYSGGTLRWKGTGFSIAETLTRTLTPAEFRDEYSKGGKTLELASFGIHTPRVTELDLQHDDADITDVTTEIPGDTVLLAGPRRIVLSVCGTYFEATRGGAETVSARRERPGKASGSGL